MADNMEPTRAGQGGLGSPAPNTSDGAGAGTSAVDYDALARALQPFIATEVERTAQSTKDKRFAKMGGKMDDFQSQLAELRDLMAGGLSEKAALRVMRATPVEPDTEAQAVAQPAAGNRPAAPKVDHSILITNLGLDANDPEVISVLREGGDELTTITKYVSIAQARKQKPAPVPNPAQQAPASSGSSVTITQASLMQRFSDMTKNVPPGEAGVKARFDAKLAIRKEAAEAGIDSPV